MKTFIVIFIISVSIGTFAQENTKLSTIEFVEILNNNIEEARFYYQNNWKKLREMALEKSYIDSYQLLETSYTEDAPYHIILITTYTNNTQFEKSENHFSKLISTMDGLKLLNNIEPKDFRRVIVSKENVRHLE